MVTLLLLALIAQEDDYEAYKALVQRLSKDLYNARVEGERVAINGTRPAAKEFGEHFERAWKQLDDALGLNPAKKVEIHIYFVPDDLPKGMSRDALEATVDGAAHALLTPRWRHTFARAAADGYLHAALGANAAGLSPALRASIKAWFSGWDGRVTPAAFATIQPDRHFMLAERTKNLLGKGKLPLGTKLWALAEADLEKQELAAWATGYGLVNGKGKSALRAHLAELAAGRNPPSLMTAAADADLRTWWGAVSLKAADRVEGKWLVGQSRYYTIRIEHGVRGGNEATMKRLKDGMDLIYGKYALGFGYDDMLPRRPALVYYANEASYAAAGAPEGTLAYYQPGEQLLVAFDSPNWKTTFETLAHEGCHQFFDLAFPGFYKSEDDVAWFSEGLAECFAACEIKGGQMFIFTLTGGGADRLHTLEVHRDEGRLVSLREMLDMGSEAFYEKADVLYAQSWAFCHFLWNAPHREGKGKYREVVIRLIDAFKRGQSREEAYKAAFVVGGKKLDIDALDREFVGYIGTLLQKKK